MDEGPADGRGTEPTPGTSSGGTAAPPPPAPPQRDAAPGAPGERLTAEERDELQAVLNVSRKTADAEEATRRLRELEQCQDPDDQWELISGGDENQKTETPERPTPTTPGATESCHRSRRQRALRTPWSSRR